MKGAYRQSQKNIPPNAQQDHHYLESYLPVKRSPHLAGLDLFQQSLIQFERALQLHIISLPKLLELVGATRLRKLTPPQGPHFIIAHKNSLLAFKNCCLSRPLIRLSFVATFVSVIPRISAISR